jgi:ABC-type multidrug transport system fused ATPase/permease subunit
MIGIGGYRYLNGAITIGTLIAIIQYSSLVMGPIQQLTMLYNMFLESGAALIHIRQSMENVQLIPESATPTPLPASVQGQITMQNVSFRYVPTVPLFEELNLVIQPHEKIGIVGETGAGKTTLINLMTRLYDVQTGAITLDGIDIRNMRHHDLLSCVAIVSQNVFLFSDTIGNNIRFGRPNATNEEIMEAARLARADGFIRQRKDGYDARLGDQGIGLSGGQRQLVAYARMILAHPKIAILDEATSNIDSYTENLIQQNMDDLFRKMTVIIIAHRFATLQRVDRIVVLRNGRIEGVGPHSELLRTNAYYRELCEKQFSKL